ncbi:MAG TPA: Ig-like domain-containing protein, partial [Candidatus Limnocylindrales bacterium]|nr:Ig-like domain-containing protein [Candidatus Limnocylindrales bacterium]
SLLPQNVGVGISTHNAVTISFDAAMNPGSVEDALQILPDQPVELEWSENLDQLSVAPAPRWRTDETYVVVVGGAARRTDGQSLSTATRYAFTTQTAPSVTDFQVRLADANLPGSKLDAHAKAMAAAALDADAVNAKGSDPLSPTTTAKSVSATSAITVSFSEEMDPADVQAHFAITPEVPGELGWEGGQLVFRPSERLRPGTRYTISVIGSHDRTGNVLGGKGNFSFIVQPGAQVTKTQPEADAIDVEPATLEIWFSQPMDVDATNKAFGLTDTANGALVGGNLTWNAAGTQLVYTPDTAFPGGRRYVVAFDGGARDADGNKLETTLAFTTKAAPVVVPAARAETSVRSAPVVPAAAPATSLAGYALNQVNAARAAYGFGPVVLDASISAVASAHAMDQAQNGYFSHYGLNGSSRESRLRAGGVSFGWSGENQCYHEGMSQQATLNWCHAQFMAEPYPGEWNHIANILNPNARRMGIGIATVGSRTVICWDFAD